MTHLNPGGETRLAPPLLTLTTTARPNHPPLGIDRSRLRDIIAARQARLSALETAMVAACEAQAARSAQRGVRVDDRETWDRAMWDRYLAAATKLEPDFLPEMLRLHSQVQRLERLLGLHFAVQAKAA
jgi:hypothetical protein